jgi:pimeloyl-ACP methyl ester carboxylesterase
VESQLEEKTKAMRYVCMGLILLVLPLPQARAADELRRRADLGFSLGRFHQGVAEVTRIVSESPAARAGLTDGDRVVAIGGASIESQVDLDGRLAALRSNEAATLIVQRRGGTVSLSFRLGPLARDREEGVEFLYEQVRNPNTELRQRIILSRPSGSKGRLPAVLFVPWLSCDSVEVPPPARGGIENLLYAVAARSGQVLARIEKPGVGDSEGNCGETDFDTELAGARAAFSWLRAHPWVDRERVVLMGHSFSGSFLPLVAPPQEVRGYLFINSFVSTWLERLLRFERRRLEAGGLPPAEVSSTMRKLSRLYVAVLEDGATPRSFITNHPDAAAVWADEPEHQYGRPIRFMQQLQALNAGAAWQTVDKPTLVVYGEADIVMHKDDHERLLAMVNRNRAGAARLITVPGMDHGLSVEGGVSPPEALVANILDWIKSVNPRP